MTSRAALFRMWMGISASMGKEHSTNGLTVIVPNHHSLTRHTVYYLIGRIATGFIGLLTLVAFTRVLSPADYGRYAVVVAVAGLLAGVGFQWLRQCLVRFGTGVDNGRQPLLGTVGALLSALLIVMAAVGGVLVLFSDQHIVRVGLSAVEVACVCCLVAAQAWFELTADSARVDFRPVRYSIATFMRAALLLALGVVAAMLTHQVVMVVFAYAVAYVVASLVTVPRWFTGLLRFNVVAWADVRRLMSYGVPLAATVGMTFILDSIDRLMLAGMRGYTEAGIYSSAYDLAQFSIGSVLYGFGLGSLPLAVGAFRRRDRTGTATLLGKNLVLSIGIGLPAVAGLVMLAPGLDRILLGNYVVGRSDPVTMIVAVATGFGAIRSYCVDVIFMLYERTWMQALVIGAAALLNVVLNVLLIPRWGSVGAAFATLAAFVFAFIASWYLSRRYLKIPIALKDIAKVLVSCAVMALALIAMSPDAGHWQRLVLSIVGGMLTYFLVAIALDVAGGRARLRALFVGWKAGN